MSAAIRTSAVTLILAASVFGAVVWLFCPVALAIELKPDDTALVNRGKTVYRQYCAACHGFTLKGQANWQKRRPDGKLPAPPHDESGHTWHHPDKQLFDLTRLGPKTLVGGDYQTDMPGYRDILSDADIIAVLSYIKSTWPAEIRKKHDAINARAKASN